MRPGIILSAALTLLVTACASTAPAPDLGSLYNHAAQFHHEERNPVIVIPGVLGSKLIDPTTGQIVWGAFGGGAANPKRPEDARLIALPMAEGVPLSELKDVVVPDGVLDRLEVKMAGLPFSLKAYYQILLTLGVGGYRDKNAHIDSIDYGPDHFTCFQFDYDWRRDNVENAQRLHRFILEKRNYVIEESRRRYGSADPNLKFDLIAHSMGGLIARYYLRYGAADLPRDGSLPTLTWAGSENVDRVVLIGTPNAGALDAAMQLTEGRTFGPMTPKYPSSLLATFPSIFQVLPRARHGALIEGNDPGKRLNPLDPTFWENLGWGFASSEQDEVLEVLLPEISEPSERRRIALDHARKSLQRAKQFQAALDVPSTPPQGTSLYLIAGDAVETAKVVTVNRNWGRLEVAEYGPGDGSVLRSSALMDERIGQPWSPHLDSPIDWTQVMFLFSDHLGMTKDPGFADNILYLLLEDPR